jgi:hypothetical protein
MAAIAYSRSVRANGSTRFELARHGHEFASKGIGPTVRAALIVILIARLRIAPVDGRTKVPSVMRIPSAIDVREGG